MPSQSTVLNGSNMAIINTETAKIFIGENRYKTSQYTNGGGGPVTIPAGKLLGQINATGKVAPLTSGAVDGSQFPVGVNVEERTVAAGVTVDLTYCVGGDVAEDKVVLDGADTLNTVVTGRTIRQRIASDTLGINLIVSKELTSYDNS